MRPLRILIDGPNAAHSLRHAVQLRDKTDRATGVLYGMLNKIDTLLRRFDPDEIVVVWEDDVVKSWRYKAFPEYKCARKERISKYTQEEQDDWAEFVKIQLPETKYALKHMGIPQICVPGLEADDVIGYLALYRKSVDHIIVSSDKDMLQLCSDTTRVYNSTKDELYYTDEFSETLIAGNTNTELAPSTHMYLAMRATCGDTSDSIPGVRGVGEKTYWKLLDGAVWNPRRESYHAFLLRIGMRGKKGVGVLDAIMDIERNFDLMTLPPKEHMIIDYFDEPAASFAESCMCMPVIPMRTDHTYPMFLKFDANVDPTPMLVFMRQRAFQLGLNPSYWTKWLASTRKLWHRHCKMIEDGYRLPTISGDLDDAEKTKDIRKTGRLEGPVQRRGGGVPQTDAKGRMSLRPARR